MATRIDKWLWSVRLFKTRKLAKEACESSKVKIKGASVKASKEVLENEIYTIRMKQYTKEVKVKQPLGSRVSAKEVHIYMEDITPHEELIKKTISGYVQPKIKYNRKGRPTKKERRELDKIINKQRN